MAEWVVFKGYGEIECGDCSIRVISNEADEIYMSL